MLKFYSRTSIFSVNCGAQPFKEQYRNRAAVLRTCEQLCLYRQYCVDVFDTLVQTLEAGTGWAITVKHSVATKSRTGLVSITGCKPVIFENKCIQVHLENSIPVLLWPPPVIFTPKHLKRGLAHSSLTFHSIYDPELHIFIFRLLLGVVLFDFTDANLYFIR